MIYNKNKINDYMAEYCNFNSDYFFRELTNPNTSLKFSKETLIQYMLITGRINDPNIELTTDLLDVWGPSYFLELYIRNTELPDKDLNALLLKLFVLPKLKSMTFTQEGSKKLMRVAEVSNEFYYENVEKLAKYYNILKRNNPNLKDDGAKLLTVISKEPTSLERDIDNKYNLSSKEIFNLPPRYFSTHYYHFNWSAIESKYWNLLCEKVKDFFNNESEMLEALGPNNSNYTTSNFLSQIKDLTIFENYKDYETKVAHFVTLKINTATTMDELIKETINIHTRLPYEVRKDHFTIKLIQEKISSVYGFDFNSEWIEWIFYAYNSYGKGRDRVFKTIEDFEEAKRNGENIDVSFDRFKDAVLRIREGM